MNPVLVALLAFVAPLSAGPEEKDSFAAIAYQAKTGAYYFSYGMPTRDMAESEVAKRTKSDKFTTVIFKNTWCALAMSADKKAFGTGEGETPSDAQDAAIKDCRKRSSTKPTILLTLHTAQGVGGDAYFAIAYSPGTGKYGVAVAKASMSEAEVEAVAKCDAKDAKVVVAAKNAAIALAVGKDKAVYGVGTAATEKEAEEMALEDCKKKTTDVVIAITLSAKK